MPDFSATAVFCEDIRQDVTGALILIGVLPDYIAVPHFPGGMASLVIYVRMHFPTDFEAQEVRIRFNNPQGDTLILNPVAESLIEQALSEAREAGASIGCIFSQMRVMQLNVEAPGRYQVHVEWSGGTFVAGHLTFKLMTPEDFNQSHA